jgi:hypothetical protein
MSLSNLKFLCLFVCLISYTSPAYAYLDPGTGTMLLQGLIFGIAVTISYVSLYWQKTKAFTKAFFVKPEPDTGIDTDTDTETDIDIDIEIKD